MTPARKAALRKAQMASARKRRRRAQVKTVGRIAGGIALTAGTGAVAYWANETAKHPVKTGRKAKAGARGAYQFTKKIKNKGKSNPSTAAKAVSTAHWGGNGYL